MWIHCLDRSSEAGTRAPFLRTWRVWQWFVEYFPLRLVKTVDLDPDEKYVFAYHPHGVISVGAFGCFGTEGAGFSRLFPGIDLRILTLAINFTAPLVREIFLSLGACSASRRSCDQILGDKGSGSAIMLVVGGAAESLDAAPGVMKLTLARQGFVRVALDHGAKLVPGACGG